MTDLLLSTPTHCWYCFEVLSTHLQGGAPPPPPFDDAHSALFVTWKVVSRNGDRHARLRGCIGCLEPRRLHSAVRDYALTSALRDSRFSPIQLRELPGLQCTVSLLSCFESGLGWQEWELGTHGIIIHFKDPELGLNRSATFLPEVPVELRWDQTQTIDALIKKAGYEGRITSQLRDSLQLTRYQSTVATLSYDEYKAMQAPGEQPLAMAAQEPIAVYG